MNEQNAPNALPRLLPRKRDAHKGDFGHALLIGGSRGMTGSISLSGMAALRSGAGLVTLGVPRDCQDVIAGFEPSYMTVGLPSDALGRIDPSAEAELLDLAKRATVVALGPGLGRSNDLTAVVVRLYREIPLPMIVDADALFHLAQQPSALNQHAAPRILTPHAGEFARLMEQKSMAASQRETEADELAARAGIIVVLKGNRTLITDGKRRVTNSTGNPGMATGGSGDVLTGVIAALVAQKMEPFGAGQLGAFVHGRAGDLAAAQLGEVSLIASDLLRYLPEAFQQFTRADEDWQE